MNILFLLTQSLESPSGLGRYAPLARHLSALNHRVTIIALHPDFINLKERILEIEGYQVHYVGQMHVRKQGNVKSYFSTLALFV